MEHFRRIVVLILVVITPAACCGFAVWLPIHLNNLRLKSFAANLYHYPLPPDSSVLDQRAELRKVGNGNNCFYEAQQSMISALPREAIEQYYEDVMLPRVSFETQWNAVYDSQTMTEIRLEFDESQSNDTTSFFTLILFDVSLDVTLDIRCH